MDYLIFLFISAFFFGGIPSAIIASYKCRSIGGWFVLGFLFFPVSILVIACLPNLIIKNQKDYKNCTFCGEEIKKIAKICLHCGNEQPIYKKFYKNNALIKNNDKLNKKIKEWESYK